jgi:hypothetical protein
VSAVDHYDADWDTMVVLDACRADVFREVGLHNKGDQYREVWSAGSATIEWLHWTFAHRTAHDTVYVTANPMHRVPEWVSPEWRQPDAEPDLSGTFHCVYDVWQDGWDETLGTVPPGVVADTARDAHREHPNKRVLVHFIQPHHPFIGEWAQESGLSLGSIERVRKHASSDEAPERRNVWEFCRDGELAADDIWRAYRENLELVWSVTENLLTEITGRVVVTSDHGNALGERGPFRRRHWEHPPGVWSEELRRVPWLVFDGSRRSVVAELPAETKTEVTPTDRLADLGYR